MTQLRRIVGKVREMQTQRDSLIQQLREAVTSDDITTQLLTMGPNEPLEPIFSKELEKHKPTVSYLLTISNKFSIFVYFFGKFVLVNIKELSVFAQ